MAEGITIIISGGRDYGDIPRMWKLLDELHDMRGIQLIVTGACKYGGADLHAENWAKDREVNYLGIPAKFKKLGGSGGPQRNKWMVQNCQPDMVICFPGGKGTASMKREAAKAGIWTIDLSGAYKISRRKLMALGRVTTENSGDG